MATYEKEYTGEYHDIKRQDKAIADIREYLNDEKDFDLILSILIAMIREGYSHDKIAFGLSMRGIQGYPVWALVIYAVNQMEV